MALKANKNNYLHDTNKIKGTLGGGGKNKFGIKFTVLKPRIQRVLLQNRVLSRKGLFVQLKG